jgi:hypothetical protein
LNFKGARLEWKRVVRQNKMESDLPDFMPSNSYPRHPRNPRF